MIWQNFLKYLPFYAALIKLLKVDERKNIAIIGFKYIIFALKGSHEDALGREVNCLAKWFDVCVIPTLRNALE